MSTVLTPGEGGATSTIFGPGLTTTGRGVTGSGGGAAGAASEAGGAALDHQQVRSLADEGTTLTAIGRALGGVHPMTVKRILSGSRRHGGL
jgi:hypothetical protein